ncbi:MAG: YihY/virulence factor BrkB family protein [Acidimicrobiia bacterium]
MLVPSRWSVREGDVVDEHISEPEVSGWSRFVATLKLAVRKWSDDKASRLGAALAYYALFSVAPLLIVAVGIAGLVFGEQAARGEIVGQIEDRVGSSVAGFLQDMMAGTRSGAGVAATVIGVVLTLLGASGLFLQIKGSLNVVWDVPPRATKGLANLVRSRALAFVSVLGFGVLLIAVLAASSLVSALGRLLSDEQSWLATLLQWLSPVVMVLLLTVVFALVFRIMPDATVPWPAAWRGAAFTSVLFTIGTTLLGLYLGSGAAGNGFGAAAALVTLLLYMYYAAQMFLLGAEFTRVLESEVAPSPVEVEPVVHAFRGRSVSPSLSGATPVAAVWAFLVGFVLGWWKGK